MARNRTSAQNWIQEQKNKASSTRKWGNGIAKSSVALFLAGSSFRGNSTIFQNEFAYELSVRLLEQISIKKIDLISSSELASYVNAFLVSCVDPRRFYTVNLVEELRKRTNAQNYTSPYVMLTLCNAGDKIGPEDIAKLENAFQHPKRQFWTDTQALVIMALSCASRQPNSVFDSSRLFSFTQEIKKRQSRNGTVENLKTTALVMQALYAAEPTSDDDNFDEERAINQILRAQDKDGSFGQSLIDTYYALPVLSLTSLANISDNHCTYSPLSEEESLQYLRDRSGAKKTVTFSLWIGNNKDVARTIELKVPVNNSLYEVMQLAAEIDHTFKADFSVRLNLPYAYKIFKRQDDPEAGIFWFLYSIEDIAEPVLIEKSPAEVTPTDKQHFIYWYKDGSWFE